MKFRTYIILFLLLGLLPDLYICLVLLDGAPVGWKWLVALPTIVAFLCLPPIGAGVWYSNAVRVISYVSFILELPKLVLTLFSLLCRHVFQMGPAAANIVSIVAGVAVSVLFLTLIFYVTRHLRVHAMDLAFPTLPAAFDGLRICQLSDLHIGSFDPLCRYIRHIVDTTLSLKPDLIVFTGDLVNFESEELRPFLRELSRLTAPLGVFSIRGNHDYLMHGYYNEAQRQEDMQRLLDLEREMGWKVLSNECILLERGAAAIALAGVENTSSNSYFLETGGDIQKALAGIPEGIFSILLSHDPTHWRSEIVPRTDIPLTLSGHTHGLRYKLVGPISNWRLHETGGIYTEGQQVLHVSKGLGSAFSFRMGGFPNIDLITLKRY